MKAIPQSILIAVTLLLAACGGASDTPTPSPTDVPESAVTIRFARSHGMGGSGSSALLTFRRLADSFQDAHPHIEVQIAELELGRGSTIADAADQADCFVWSSREPEPADLAAVLSLQPALDADPSFPIDDFYPSLLAQFTWQGELRGLPSEAMPYVLKINKDLFDAAGVPYPAPDWTTDDLTQTAIALTRGQGDDKQYGFVSAPFEFQELMLMLERRGAILVNANADPPTVRFDDPATIEALQWYVGLSTELGAKPVFITDMTQMVEAEAVFKEWQDIVQGGRAAMWTLGESVDLFSDPRGLNVGLAPIPAGPGKPAGAYSSVTGYFISAQTEARQACWDWITFLTAQPEAVRAAPARRSVVESDAFREKVGPDRAAVYGASLEGADRPPNFSFRRDEEWLFGGAIVWLSRAYTQAVTGEASVERALEAAQQTFEDYRACILMQDALAEQEVWVACMGEADPEWAKGLVGGQ